MKVAETATSEPLTDVRGPRLRIGIIVDSLVVPMWIHNALEHLEKSTVAELTVIIKLEPASEMLPEYSLLFRWWSELDERLFRYRSARPQAFEMRTYQPRGKLPEILQVQPAWNERGFALSPIDRKMLKQFALDVLLQLSSGELVGDASDLATYGTWSFQNACDLLVSMFWTLYGTEPVVTNGIDVAVGGSAHSRLRPSYSAADNISLFRNYSNVCWKRSDILARCLADLHHHGWHSLDAQLHAMHSMNRVFPANIDVIMLLVKLLLRILAKQVSRRLFREKWFIAVRKRPDDHHNVEPSYAVLLPPRGHFYADPFLLECKGKPFILFEDYSFREGKAVISVVELGADGKVGRPEAALAESYHLSYPCLFRWRGDIYMLPETKDNRTVQIYRAVDFPYRWELAQVLFDDLSLVDSTLLLYDGKFWLFTSGFGTSDPWFDGDSELFLFYSNSPLGRWIPHPLNPVVRDVRRCRSAGQFFLRNGQLIRPAQDCSVCYGHAVCLNRVDAISVNDYREIPLSVIGPEWMPGNIGTHTYNCSEHYEVLDGRTLTGRFLPSHARPVLRHFFPSRPMEEPYGYIV